MAGETNSQKPDNAYPTACDRWWRCADHRLISSIPPGSKAPRPELLDHKGGLPTVAFAINSSSKRNSCLATRLSSTCLPRTSLSQAQPQEP